MPAQDALQGRLWVFPPQIRRSEIVSAQAHTRTVRGRYFRLTSDYPVVVEGDNGQEVAWAGAPLFPQDCLFRRTGRSEALRFKFPLGYGGDPAFGLATDDDELRHGAARLLWSWDEYPPAPQLHDLPMYSWHSEIDIAAAAQTGFLQVQSGNTFEFDVEFAATTVRAAVVHLTTFTVGTVTDTTPQSKPPAGEFCHSMVASKLPSGVVADGFEIFNLDQGPDTQVQRYMGDLRIPWGSYMSQWASETPSVIYAFTLDQVATVNLTIKVRLVGRFEL